LDEALALVRHILELDQTDAQARQWRRELPEKIKQQTLQARIRTLTEQAEADNSQRNYPAALEKLAEAVRLDRTNQKVRSRLDEILAEQERVEQAARLVAEAQKEYEQNALTVAIEHARDAVRTDPNNPEAPALADKIRREIERRDAENQRRESLNRAKGLILVQAYENAIPVLRDLETRYPDDQEVKERLAEARRLEAAYTAQKKIDAAIQDSRELIRKKQYQLAIDLLDGLDKDIPQKRQVAELLTYAREQLEAERRSAEIEDLIRRASDAPTGDFESGLRHVDRALDLDPANEKALRVRKKLLAIRQADQENRSIQRSVQEGRAFLLAAKLDEAQTIASELKAKRPDHPSVIAFDTEVQRLVRERNAKREREIETRRREVERLIDQGLAGDATKLLTTLKMQYPSEQIFQDLLPRAAASEQEQKKREAIRGTLVRTAELAAAKRWDHALAELEKGLSAWPSSPELLLERDRILRLKSNHEAAEDIQQLLARHELEAAIAAADSLLAKFPGEAQILELRELGRKQLEFERLSKEAESLVIQGDFDRAEPMVDEMLRLSPGDGNGQRLKQIVQGKRKRQQDFAAADQLCKRRKFQEAHDLVIRILLEDPVDGAAADLLKRIERESFEYERQQWIDRALADASALVRQRQYLTAVQLLERSTQEFPDEQDLHDALRRAREAMAQSERKEAIDRGRTELEALMKQRQFEQAMAKASQLAESFPEEQFQQDYQAAAKAKELSDHKVEIDAEIREIQKLFQKNDTAGVRARCERLLAKDEEPRARALLDWAVTTEADLRRVKKKTAGSQLDWRWIAAAVGVVVVGLAAWKFWPSPTAGELSVTPTDLSFSYTPGVDTLVPAKTLQLTGKPANATWVVMVKDKWFSASPTEPIGDGPIQVTVDPRQLSQGDHTGVLIVSGKHVSVSPVQVTIHLTINPPPLPTETLRVTPRELPLTWRKGDPLPADQSLQVTGNPAGQTWVAQVNKAWLRVTPSEGTGEGAISVHVDPQQLAPNSDHSGVVTVSGKAGTGKATINLHVSPPEVIVTPPTTPEVRVSPTTLTFTYKKGDSPPGLQTFQVIGKPAGETWVASTRDPWIKANPGELAGDGSVSVQVDPTGLTVDRTGQVVVSSRRVPTVRAAVRIVLNIVEAPTATFPAAIDCHDRNVYHGSAEGDITWQGTLGAKQTVSLGRNYSVLAAPSGATSQSYAGKPLPGCPVVIDPITQGIEISEYPGPTNNFGKVTMRNTTSEGITGPKLHWKVK
jgi:hypothetical protein